jgi:hypothetical protein
MKKVLIILLLTSGSTRLKAQQIAIAPNLKLNNGPEQPFKTDSIKKPHLLQPDNGAVMLKFNSINPKDQGIIVYSTMPVAKVSSSDRMPVARPGKNSYTMLVQKVTVINPLEPAKTQLP